jgi:hypothetical protein
MTDSGSSVRFGFLPYKWEISFDYGRIVPIASFDEVASSVKKRLHEDGFLYPPTAKIITEASPGKTRTLPRTKRPAHFFPVPPSHDLLLHPQDRESDLREERGGFLVQCLAFFFRTRLQFADWFYDGRIPVQKQRGIGVIITNRFQAGRYLGHAYDVWSGWSENERRRFVNILYMFSRTQSYEWNWEEFIIEYMVLDACWKMAEGLLGLRCKTHKDRVRKLCDHFAIKDIDALIDIEKMVKLRNDLFHETLWHDGKPGSSSGVRRVQYDFAMRMWQLNETLIGKFLQLP